MTPLRYFMLGAVATLLGVVSVQIRQENYRLKREMANGQRLNERIAFETENAKLVFTGTVSPLELTRKSDETQLRLLPTEGKDGVWLTAPIRLKTFGHNPNLYPRQPDATAPRTVELLAAPDAIAD